MTSPFFGFDNAILTFQVADGTHTTNAIGNRIPNTRPVEILALLKVTQSQSTLLRYANEIEQFAGADGYADVLEGYLVDPTTYPDGVEFLAVGDISIKMLINRVETGKFKLLPVLQSPYFVATGIDLITPILGIFRRN